MNPTLEALCDAAGVPVFLDTVSCVKAQRLRGIIGRFDTIKPNRMELEALTDIPADTEGACAALRGRCCKRACGGCLSRLGPKGFITRTQRGVLSEGQAARFPW